jgi:hypothetical protein
MANYTAGLLHWRDECRRAQEDVDAKVYSLQRESLVLCFEAAFLNAKALIM